MNVLVVNHYPTYGGPHNEIVEIAPRLGRRGFTVTAVIPDDAEEPAMRLEAAGVDVVRLELHRRRAKLDPSQHLRYALAVRSDIERLLTEIRRREIDLVQVSGLVNAQAAVAARRAHIPLVWQLVDSRTPEFLARLFTRRVIRTADAVMTTGESIIGAHPGLETVRDRVVTYLPPVDTTRFRPVPEDRNTARAELGVARDSFLIASVGNITPQKGHEYLIRAFRLLQQQDPSARLRIVGATSAGHGRYESLLRELSAPVGDDVLLSGAPVHRFLQAPDVFVLNAVPRSEGVSTVVLEAMASGLPVVAADVGGLREVVENGVTGFLVQPRDETSTYRALWTLCGDPGLRAQMGRAARNRALDRFGLDRTVDSYIKAYDVAVANHREREGA